MMRRTYQKAFDIWQTPDYLRGHILPGQWIFAGDRAHMGRYLGQGRAGSDVVAWRGNYKNHPKGARAYIRTLRQYAKGVA
jgi:hypothetical protein